MAIPAPKPTDAEDVSWALSTAETLWKRNERVEAISWVKRAARAAGEADDDLRAVELARAAVELSESSTPRPSAASIEVEVEVPQGEASVEAVDPEDVATSAPPLPAPPRPPPPQKAPPKPPPPPRKGTPSVSGAPPRPPPALAQNGAATDAAPSPSAAAASLPPPDDEPARPPLAASLGAPSGGPLAPRAPVIAGVVSASDDDEGPLLEAEPRARPAPLRTSSQTMPGGFGTDVTMTVKAAPPRQTLETLRRLGQARTKVEEVPLAPRTSAVAAPPAALPVSSSPPSREPERLSEALPPSRLEALPELGDLPDDVRASLAAAAAVLRVSDAPVEFGLALVLEGGVDVVPVGASSPAAHLGQGILLLDRCSVPSDLGLRLLAPGGGAKVAIWTAAVVDEHLTGCPWVEDELKSAASLVHALAGIERGALGRRMDPGVRYELTKTLAVRMVPEGEVVALAGEPVPGILVVGVGELELVQGEQVTGKVRSGEFLFPLEVLGGAKAQRTARGGKGGALVLAGDRKRTQEIVVSYPALLEILAG